MLKRMLQRFIGVYTCQSAALLEITCHGSFLFRSELVIILKIHENFTFEKAPAEHIHSLFDHIMFMYVRGILI